MSLSLLLKELDDLGLRYSKYGERLVLTYGSFGKIIYTICNEHECHAYDFRYDGHKDYIPKRLIKSWNNICKK